MQASGAIFVLLAILASLASPCRSSEHWDPATRGVQPHHHHNAKSHDACQFRDARPNYVVECPVAEETVPAEATVVTAYMHVPSKTRSMDEFFRWVETFMQLNASVVMYIDVAYGHVFAEMPTNNRIVAVHTSMGAFKSTSCGMGLWKEQHSMDCPEQTNSPPLYAVWAEKTSLLYEAARANCFKSTHLFWVDIGSFRKGGADVPSMQPFPVPELLPQIEPGCMLWSALGRHILYDHWKHFMSDSYNTSLYALAFGQRWEAGACPANSVDGSAHGGDLQAITEWYHAYYEMLDLYLEHGWFAGIDQDVFASTCLKHSRLCHFHAAEGWYDIQEIMQGHKQIVTWHPSYWGLPRTEET